MKTFIIILAAAVAGFLIGHYAFKGNDAKNACCGTPNPADTINTLNFERRSSAEGWVKSYQTIWDNIIKDSILKDSIPRYFTIKSQDVLNAMGIDSSWRYETKLRYIRLTLGYDKAEKSVKAFIQPVVNVDLKKKSAGVPLFFNLQGQIVDSSGKPIDSLNKLSRGKGVKSGKIKAKTNDTGTYVGDLSTPCPNTCGS